MTARLLVSVLRDPVLAQDLDVAGWNSLIAAAKAERLIAALALRLEPIDTPPAVRPILADAMADAAREGQQAVWEADRAAHALRGLDVPVILLKGAAYVATGLAAGQGRFVGDLDILVPRIALRDVETALFAAGWEWVKEDSYDDAYYRQWMHELPPMIHAERDRMIDVHHTILPLTARPKPDAAAMIADARSIGDGLYIFSPEDRVIHAAAHMLADGDLQGGLRNLWDIHLLLRDAQADRLAERARLHGLASAVEQATRLAAALYGQGSRLTLWDRIVIARLVARNGWGRESRKLLVFAFFVRSHWLRMPPLMLARHLWTKWRKGHRPQ